MIGSTGSSTRIRDARRLGEVEAADSEKLLWEVGGNGDREREFDRELCAECVGRTGMWIVRESLREAVPCDAHDVGRLPLPGALRGLAMVSPGIDIGADPDPGSGFLSLGRVFCRLRDDGLEEMEAVRRPGEEDQRVRPGLGGSSENAR